MKGTKVVSQPAFILHTRAYRETSLLIDAFTLDYGRVSLIAKGVRKKKSRSAALLQPFNELLITWQGKTDLQTIVSVDASDDSLIISGKTMYCAFYINELLTILLYKHDPHPVLYGLYKKFLTDLVQSSHNDELLRYFEVNLLSEIGYGLNLDAEYNSGFPFISEQLYRYDFENGAFQISSDPYEITVHGHTLTALHEKQLDNKQSRLEAKRLMRAIIHHHLEGRPLRSRELFKPMKTRIITK